MSIANNCIGYVYCITNRANGKQYIGQTNVSVESRYTEHIRCARAYTNPTQLLYRSIRKYGSQNFEVTTIDVVSAKTKFDLKQLLNELEVYYISKYNTYTPNGYNMTKGGYAFAEHVTKGVYIVQQNGFVCNYYLSMRDASFATGVDERAIWHACHSTSHYAKGLFWYLEDYGLSVGTFIKEQSCGKKNWAGHKTYTGKTVYQYSKDGTYIDTFESASEAAKELNISQAHISKCCCGSRKTAGGYRWSFSNEILTN